MLGAAALELDVEPLLWGIDDGPRPTPFEQAQRLAADAWGAQRTWFLVNGASSANHAICMTFAARGRSLIVQRNVHGSTIDGLVLSGLRPHFVAPGVDRKLGVAHCLDPAELAQALDRIPDAAGVVVVSPTYFGMCADVPGLVAVAHERGVPIAVDEAWGAHLAFSPTAVSALEAGADLVVSSTHKMLGSLGQSAMLHLGSGQLVDGDLVDRAVTLQETTSASALLSVSLDAVRAFAVAEAPALLAATARDRPQMVRRLELIPGVTVLDENLIGDFGIRSIDGQRLSLDVSGTGVSGRALATRLREAHGYLLELVTDHVLMAILAPGERAADVEPLASALEETVHHERGRGVPPAPDHGMVEWGPLRLRPRDAYLAAGDRVQFADAAGRVAAEAVSVYPPGIPNVLPGEEVTADVVDFVEGARRAGAVIRGASDRSGQTIRVVARDHRPASGDPLDARSGRD